MQRYGQTNRGHMTYIYYSSPAIKAIPYVAYQAGAVPLSLSKVLTASIIAAAAIFLCRHKHPHTCTHTNNSGWIFRLRSEVG